MNVSAWMFLVITWGVLVYRITKKINTPKNIEYSKTFKKVNKILKYLHKSSLKNVEFLTIIEKRLDFLFFTKNTSQKITFEKLEYQLQYITNILEDKNDNSFYADVHLIDYEVLLRRMRQSTQEMSNYIRGEFKIIQKSSKLLKNIIQEIQNVSKISAEYKRSIISNIDQIYLVDGRKVWRQKKTEYLSNLVQKRLDYIQNPVDCKTAKKLLCNTIENNCGLGCQLHHFVFCFIVAYATERTMILYSKGWQYEENDWEGTFQPISKTCKSYNITKAEIWPGSINSELLLLPHALNISVHLPYFPLAVPEDLVPRLKKIHGYPSVWWIGEFLKYLFKPKVNMQILDWKKPIVGVHVRRTDKIIFEAEYHYIEEYMIHVEDYYLTLEMSNPNVERRVFLATDDLYVVIEARIKYPKYTIISTSDIIVSKYYTTSSLNGIILDMYLLSLTDYVVCTFSSNVCRAVYAIMQNYNPDASNRVKSIDFFYYFDRENIHYHEAILSHNPNRNFEISAKSGDLIGVDDNTWNGHLLVKNYRTGKMGFIPSYKVEYKIETAKFPTYSNVN